MPFLSNAIVILCPSYLIFSLWHCFAECSSQWIFWQNSLIPFFYCVCMACCGDCISSNYISSLFGWFSFDFCSFVLVGWSENSFRQCGSTKKSTKHTVRKIWSYDLVFISISTRIRMASHFQSYEFFMCSLGYFSVMCCGDIVLWCVL